MTQSLEMGLATNARIPRYSGEPTADVVLRENVGCCSQADCDDEVPHRRRRELNPSGEDVVTRPTHARTNMKCRWQ